MKKEQVNVDKMILRYKLETVANMGLFNGVIASCYYKVLSLIIEQETDKYKKNNKADPEFMKKIHKEYMLRHIFSKFSKGINLPENEMMQMVDFMMNYPIDALMRINIDPLELININREIVEMSLDISKAWAFVRKYENEENISLIDYYKLYFIKRYVLAPYKSVMEKGEVVKLK